MELCTPESMGISSEHILNFVKKLDDSRLATHDLLVMRGGKMVFEAYVPFPQDGYGDLVGTQPGERRYHCAASAAWTMPETLMLKVQVLDTYFGVLHARFGFKEDKIGLTMLKCAEGFLDEYEGHAGGQQEKSV
ncbi:MAG: hypothetical protein U0L92_04015 [Clostridia bacterium]|nr:hypothetical protein [Clostridia bacterium]